MNNEFHIFCIKSFNFQNCDSSEKYLTFIRNFKMNSLTQTEGKNSKQKLCKIYNIYIHTQWNLFCSSLLASHFPRISFSMFGPLKFLITIMLKNPAYFILFFFFFFLISCIVHNESKIMFLVFGTIPFFFSFYGGLNKYASSRHFWTEDEICRMVLKIANIVINLERKKKRLQKCSSPHDWAIH